MFNKRIASPTTIGVIRMAFVTGAAALAFMGSICGAKNKAPSVPAISGPSAGVVGVAVTFKATTTDPDGDSVAFQFDWGDGTTPAWTAVLASDDSATATHIYSDSGSFTIKAKAKDAKGNESEWSAGAGLAILGVGSNYPDTVLAVVVLQEGSRRGAITPDGRMLYVVHQGLDVVSPVRLADRQVLPSITVGSNPFDIVASPDGDYMYVCCATANTVVAIRTSDNTVVDSVSVPDGPQTIGVTPDGQYLFVGGWHSNRVTVLRASDLAVLDTVPLPPGQMDIVAHPALPYMYVQFGNSSVAVIRTSDFEVVDTVKVGEWSSSMTISHDGSYLYVANAVDSGFDIVRTSDNEVVGGVKVGKSTLGDIATLPGGHYVLATDWYGVRYVDMRVNAVVDSLHEGARGGLVPTQDGDAVCVLISERLILVGSRNRMQAAAK